MTALPIYGKTLLKIFSSKTDGQMVFKLGMKHRVMLIHRILWKDLKILAPKILVIRAVLMSTKGLRV